MAYGVLTTGFEAKPLDVIETEMKEGLRAAISPTLNLGSRSLLGQFVSVVASQLRQLWEAGQVQYASVDPAQATGDALTSRAELTGTERDAASKSQAYMTITLTAGTYAAGLLKVNVTGDTTKVFENAEEITTAGATLTDQLFLCTQTGPISAPSGTLVNITTPVAGFSAPNNPASAILGTDVEEDSDLRQRREDQLQIGGSSNVDAIRANLLDNDNVTFATVLENDTDTTDSNGVPPYSIAPVVLGGSDDEVAELIFAKKAAGPPSYGSTTVVVNDAAGNPHNINFTRPTPISFGISFVGTYVEDDYETAAAAEEAVEAAIAAYAAEVQTVGLDVVLAKYAGVCIQVDGIVDGITQIYDGTLLSTNLVVGPFEYATHDLSYQAGQVVLTPVSGAP